MTPPTDTVTPERLKALKELCVKLKGARDSSEALYFSVKIGVECPALIAYVERVEKEHDIQFKTAKDAAENWMKATQQRDRALAKLKELGEKFRKKEQYFRRESEKPDPFPCDGRIATTFRTCAEAAEAAHKEVAG